MSTYIITGEPFGTRAQVSPYSLVTNANLGVGQKITLSLSAQDEATLIGAGILALYPGDGTYRGAWAPNRQYFQNDVVLQAGSLYESNQDFTSSSSFNAANWTQLSGSGGSGSSPSNFRTVTTTATAAANDFMLGDATGGAFTIAPPASPTVGQLFAVKKTDATANAVNVSGTIDGDAGGVSIVSQNHGVVLEWSGAGNWKIAGTFLPGGGSTAPLVPVATVTAAGALVAAKHNPVDATAGTLAMTLPTGQAAGTQISAEKEDATANLVNVTGSIRGVGATTLALKLQNESQTFVADSAGSWWPASGHKTLSSLDARYGTTLDTVPAPAAPVAMNAKKITGLANGTAATDAAAFGQIPASLSQISGALLAVRRAGAAPLPGSLGALVNAVPQKTTFATPNAGNFTTRQSFKTGPQPLTDPVLLFGQFIPFTGTTTGDANVGNTAIYKCSIEFNSKSFKCYSPQGARLITVDDGSWFTMRATACEIPANTQFWVRTQYQGATYIESAYTGVNSSIADTWGNGDLVDATGVLGNALASGGGAVAPLAIGGNVPSYVPEAACVGDSRIYGQGDSQPGRGWLRIALWGASPQAIPSTMMAVQASTAQSFLVDHSRTGVLIGGRDYGFDCTGVNDVDNTVGNRSQANVQADRTAIWFLLQRRVNKAAVFAATMPPETTSTDAWVTVGNQTVKFTAPQEAIRVAVNTWLLAGAPLDPATFAPVAVGTGGAVLAPVYSITGTLASAGSGSGHPLALGGVIDPNGIAESSPGSGKWAAPGGVAQTADGIHPNGTGHTAWAACVPTSLLV